MITEIILPHFKIAQNLEGLRGFEYGTEVEVIGDHDDLLIVKEVLYGMEKNKLVEIGFGKPYHMRTENFKLKPVPKPIEKKPEPVPVATGSKKDDLPDVKNMSFDELAQWAKKQGKK